MISLRVCVMAWLAPLAMLSAASAQEGGPSSGPVSIPPARKESPIVLENEFVRVARDKALCMAAGPACVDRIILAMEDLDLDGRTLQRGTIALFKQGQSFPHPNGGSFFEITIKPDHPAAKPPAEMIAAPNNLPVFDGARFFIYEERLEIGATRPRHSHSSRLEIRINQGPRLEQWVWRGDQVVFNEPAIVNWRDPVVHVVKNVGDAPLRNFILEFKPEPREIAPRER